MSRWRGRFTNVSSLTPIDEGKTLPVLRYDKRVTTVLINSETREGLLIGATTSLQLQPGCELPWSQSPESGETSPNPSLMIGFLSVTAALRGAKK